MFVELARSVRTEVKDVICMDLLVCRVHLASIVGRLKRGDSATEKTTISWKTSVAVA